jgi:diguanylate cyclase (GGDEF)-like protein
LDWQILQHRVRFLMRASKAFADLRRTLSDLRGSQERLANAQRIARVGNWEWVPESEEMLWSDEVYRILGIAQRPGASIYPAFVDAVDPNDRDAFEKAMQGAVLEGKSWALDHRIHTAAGDQRVVHQEVEVAMAASGAPVSLTGTIQDITARRRAEQQIRHLAYYDSLTALPNRKMLHEHLSQALENGQRRHEIVALLCLDLDRFNRVNDTLGHETGDELLKIVASRLLQSVRASDYIGRSRIERSTVSRLEGDEFTVVLNQIQSSEDAAQVALRILVGIAVSPTDGSSPEALLQSAESALHSAKEEGRGCYRFFNPSMNENAMRKLKLENALRRAIASDGLALEYQPQRETATGTVSKVEALARWESPEFGPVQPCEFIPLAEETGLIGPLGEWVLRRACAQARECQRAGLPPLKMAINISSYQVRHGDLLEVVDRALTESGLDPRLLELEITESAIIGDEPGVLETLNGLKAMGIHLALDDFGTGYSSLSHVARFPIDVLKVDQSFVGAIESEEQASAIISAVIAMAHRLGLSVTAEGVETAEQEEFLRTQGCDALQGFRLCRPLDPEKLEVFLREEAER